MMNHSTYKNSLFQVLLAAFFILPFSATTEAANRYWVASTTADWNDTGNWSTSSGGSSGASVPGSLDVAFFNSNGVGNCTVNAAIDVKGLDVRNSYSGSISQGSYNITVGSSYFYINTGTFVGGSGSISVDRFYMSGGTFTSTSGTFTCTGPVWQHTGGTFNHGNGTVSFTGSGPTIETNSTVFNNLTFNGAGNMGLDPNGGTLTTVGSLVMGVGHLYGSAGTFTIYPQGNITIQSSYQGGYGSVSFIVNGSQSIQQFDLTGATASFNHNLTISKTAGELKLMSDFTMDNGSQKLVFTSGTLNLNGYSLINVASFSDNRLTISGDFTVSGTGLLRAYKYYQTTGTFTISGASSFTVDYYFSLTSGTFNGGSSTMDFNVASNSMVMTGGIFNATTGTLNMVGWNQSSGCTFNHNNGTVIFDGTSSPVLTFNATTNFYNLTINVTGSQADAQGSASKITANGTLTLSGAQVGNAFPLEAFGNVVVGSGYGGGTSPLTFAGSAATQTFTLTSGFPDKYKGNIIVDKSSGIVQLINPVTVASGKSLTITSGTLDLNGQTLTLTGSCTVQTSGILQLQGGETVSATPSLNAGSTVVYNGTSTSYTIKNWTYSNMVINGGNSTIFYLAANLNLGGTLTLTDGDVDALSYTLTHSGLTGTNGSYEVDLGSVNAPSSSNLGNLGLVVTSSADLGNTTIKLMFTPISAGGNTGIRRSYQVTPTNNSGLDATVVFNYFDTELNGITESNLILFKSTNGTTWSDLSSSLNTSTNQLTMTGLGNLDWLTAGSSASPLPVSLLYLQGEAAENHNELLWATASETNNDFFTVEKSLDGRNFTELSRMEGAGNSNHIITYNYADISPNRGANYYRLKQTDFDGSTSYSNVIVVMKRESTLDRITLFPNPAIDKLTISGISIARSMQGKVEILDVTGAVVSEIYPLSNQESNNFQLDVSHLPRGVYFLQFDAIGTQVVKRFVVAN